MSSSLFFYSVGFKGLPSVLQLVFRESVTENESERNTASIVYSLSNPVDTTLSSFNAEQSVSDTKNPRWLFHNA